MTWIRKVKAKSFSRVRLFATPWTIAYQDPQSMEFYRQEYWSGLPFPSPGDLPNPGIKPQSPALQTEALLSEPPGIRKGKVNRGESNQVGYQIPQGKLIPKIRFVEVKDKEMSKSRD